MYTQRTAAALPPGRLDHHRLQGWCAGGYASRQPGVWLRLRPLPARPAGDGDRGKSGGQMGGWVDALCPSCN